MTVPFGKPGNDVPIKQPKEDWEQGYNPFPLIEKQEDIPLPENFVKPTTNPEPTQ